MKLISIDEYIHEICSGTGVTTPLETTISTNGKQIIVLDNSAYLFNPQEIGTEEYYNLLSKLIAFKQENADLLKAINEHLDMLLEYIILGDVDQNSIH